MDIWRRKWQPTPVLLPRKFHGWRSLVGSSLSSHTHTQKNYDGFIVITILSVKIKYIPDSGFPFWPGIDED